MTLRASSRLKAFTSYLMIVVRTAQSRPYILHKIAETFSCFEAMLHFLFRPGVRLLFMMLNTCSLAGMSWLSTKFWLFPILSCACYRKQFLINRIGLQQIIPEACVRLCASFSLLAYLPSGEA